MTTKYIGSLGNLEGEAHTRLWFGLSSHEKFSNLGKPVSFAKGEIVAQAGRHPTHCYYVLEGRMMAFEYTTTTGERYYNFNEAGSLVMEANILLERDTPVSFVAITDVKARAISREELLRALKEDDALALEIMTSLSYKFMAAMDQVREATQCNVAWKVCNLLLTFAERYGVPYDGKTLFDYLKVGLVPLNGDFVPVQKAGKTIIYALDEAEDFYTQVGKNTNYLIHPEEIMADNFAFTLIGKKDLANPEIIQNVQKVLKAKNR